MILILPEGLKFFQFGWWVIHAVAIYLVYSYAFRRGRREERQARDAEKTTGERPPRASQAAEEPEYQAARSDERDTPQRGATKPTP